MTNTSAYYGTDFHTPLEVLFGASRTMILLPNQNELLAQAVQRKEFSAPFV
jgi:hypothetical protein